MTIRNRFVLHRIFIYMKKSYRITIRLTEEQMRRLVDNLDGEQLTKSQIIREMIDNYDSNCRDMKDSNKNEIRMKIGDINTNNLKTNE